MSDDAMIRRTNLRKLGKSASELAALGIGGYSYWAAMLAENSTKAFGEKVARKLEEGLSLPRGYLDHQDYTLTGESGHYDLKLQTDAPAENPGTASATGMEIALLYDLIPVTDRVRRVRAYNAATKAILAVLEEHPATAAGGSGAER